MCNKIWTCPNSLHSQRYLFNDCIYKEDLLKLKEAKIHPSRVVTECRLVDCLTGSYYWEICQSCLLIKMYLFQHLHRKAAVWQKQSQSSWKLWWNLHSVCRKVEMVSASFPLSMTGTHAGKLKLEWIDHLLSGVTSCHFLYTSYSVLLACTQWAI